MRSLLLLSYELYSGEKETKIISQNNNGTLDSYPGILKHEQEVHLLLSRDTLTDQK